MKTPKSSLYELCQKKGWEFPKTTYEFEGEAHTGIWIATVILMNDDTSITVSCRDKSKKNAEHMACLSILEKYNEINSETICEIDNQKKISLFHNDEKTDFLTPEISRLCNSLEIWMIDLENKPVFDVIFNPDDIVIGFATSLFHSLNRYQKWHRPETLDLSDSLEHSRCLLIVAEGGVRDLADHMITMYTGVVAKYLGDNPEFSKVKINLISGDAAIWCTKICLETMLKWNDVQNTVINVSSCVN
jgi:hypothetical protein